jgi:tetratricopeptide (TPR) repeat protein
LLAEAERVMHSDRSAFSRGVVQAATARVSLAKGDTARAVEWARRAVATFESAGLSNASLVAAKTALARALNANGQHAEALTIADLNLATALGRKTDLKYTSTVGAILLETAIAQRGVGEFALARGSIKTAMEQLDNSVGANAEISNRARQVLAGLSESG